MNSDFLRSIAEIFTNPLLITAVSSWFFAQVLKVIINGFVNKKWELERLFGDGGMPSGHSATVTSLAMASGLVYGFGGFEFAVTFILAVIVCHDAMGVRQETGKQAMVINEIMRTFDLITEDSVYDVKLKELVGHTPVQVTAGVLLGIVNALVMNLWVL